ncbi:MAG: type IX secretion system sortase PorU [Bacteroidaceae bacterium]|nr:type IX secretion system sortase PorU [Bacteroidaceae bacterium]
MKYLFSILLSVLTMNVAATGTGDFTFIDWERLPIDSILPQYTEVVPLETDYRQNNYTVNVEFAEWQTVTAREQEIIARRFASEISDTLTISATKGVSRRKGMLDIAFVPIIRSGNTYLKLLSGKIVITAHPTAAAKRIEARHSAENADRYASHSRLASGRWMTVTLSEDGIYQLTDDALLQMGFTTPANCRIYGQGGHLLPELIDEGTHSDDLIPVSTLRLSDRFLFHANGLTTWTNGHHVVNHYANQASYFITEADSPAEDIESVSPRATSDSVTILDTYTAYLVHDPQAYSWFQGGRQLFEDYDYYNGNAKNYTVKAVSHIPASSTASFKFSFSASDRTQITPTINGTSLGEFNISALADEYTKANIINYNYPNQDLPVLATNTVRFTTTASTHARLNYFEMTYTGSLRLSAEHPYLEVYMPADSVAQAFVIEYADGMRPQCWLLDGPNTPAVNISGSLRDSTDANGTIHHYLDVNLTDVDSDRRYAVFDAASTYPSPTIGHAIENQDLHALDSIDMLIITPASGIFDAQAERLADAHRTIDGLGVAVVRADQIFNEFSSGTPDATAFRLLLKMLYDRAENISQAPRYLLLFGDGAWDNRMLTSAWKMYDPDDFLLCFESQNSVSDTRSYVMEEYYGLLDDGEGGNLTNDKTDIGVGRFPVRTVSDANTMVDKTIAYIEKREAGAWRNIVCMMGDDGDNNDHMVKTDNVANLISETYPSLEVRKVMWDSYKRETRSNGNRYPQVEKVIKEQMEEGALVMNYTGHGSTYCLSHEFVLLLKDFAEFSSPRYPLWVTAACDIMPFDGTQDNIGETAVLNPNGGAVAFFGTTRTVYAGSNLLVNRAFSQVLFGRDDNGGWARVGDAVRMAKVNVITNGRDVNAENKLQFVLLGDPALSFNTAPNSIVLDSINGISVDALPDGFTLHAGGKARFSGHVNASDGSPINDFDGILSARLYDSQNYITCYNQTAADSAFKFNAYNKILYNGSDSIRAGRFSVSCPIPIDINYSDDFGRLQFYAISSDGVTEANGYSDTFLVGGTEPSLQDKTGPTITAWLTNEEFTDGDAVNSTPYFVARLEDESGINSDGNGLGHDLELIIDNSASKTYILNDYFTADFGDYTRGSVAFSIPQLEEGDHTLLFRAWDNLNNTSTATLRFVVDPTLPMSILQLAATQNPASTSTSFILSFDRPGSECEFTLEVFDFSGHLLWTYTASGASSTGTYAVPWNLCTSSGFPLGAGIYLYRARVKSDNSEEVSKTQKIIIYK